MLLLTAAAHPFYTIDCRDSVPPGSQASVRLGDIVFSQASVGKLVGGAWEDETVYQTVQEMLGMSIEDRRAYIAARFDQVRVVPIRRRLDAPGDSTNRLMVSLDNRRLLIMRATLPADERINVRIATDREYSSELEPDGRRGKWTSRNEGYTIKVRGTGAPIGKFHLSQPDIGESEY